MTSKNKTIFITGTSLGIGRATVSYFLQKGWNVVATMRDIAKEKEFKTNNTLLIAQVDVRDSASIENAFKAGVEKFGKIDVIVNNAGYGLLGPLELTTETQVKDQFDTNVLGVVNVTRTALAHFRSEDSERGKLMGGTIVNVSSMLGRITLPFMSMYIASKFAVEGMSEGLYYELKDFNIKVKLIEPGTIKTDFFTSSIQYAENKSILAYEQYWQKVKNNLTNRGAHGEDPAVVAKVIYKAVTDNSNKLRYTVDKTAKLLIFLRSISPLPLFRFIVGLTVR